MFNLSFSHMVMILVIALIFIGPQQLPEVARTIGRFINELRRASSDLTDSFWEAKNSPPPPPMQPPAETIHTPTVAQTEPTDSGSGTPPQQPT